MTRDLSRPPLPELSENTVNTLKSLRETDLPSFYAHIVSLRDNKWPLRAIAQPLEVSRSIVSIWEKKYDSSVDYPESEQMPETPVKEKKSAKPKFAFSPKEVKELKDLAHEASKVRRFTDEKAESRNAASRLEKLLIFYREKGASLGQMAKACEVSRSSIAQRLRKYESPRV